jgi:hypothetical protein
MHLSTESCDIENAIVEEKQFISELFGKYVFHHLERERNNQLLVAENVRRSAYSGIVSGIDRKSYSSSLIARNLVQNEEIMSDSFRSQVQTNQNQVANNSQSVPSARGDSNASDDIEILLSSLLSQHSADTGTSISTYPNNTSNNATSTLNNITNNTANGDADIDNNFTTSEESNSRNLAEAIHRLLPTRSHSLQHSLSLELDHSLAIPVTSSNPSAHLNRPLKRKRGRPSSKPESNNSKSSSSASEEIDFDSLCRYLAIIRLSLTRPKLNCLK